jgi:hypothetical protein
VSYRIFAGYSIAHIYVSKNASRSQCNKAVHVISNTSLEDYSFTTFLNFVAQGFDIAGAKQLAQGRIRL